MEGEIKKLGKVWVLIVASLCYCYFIASRIPKGKLRLFSLFPILFIFTILPLSLSCVFPIGLTTTFFSWLGNFKLLLFAFDKGPLSSSSSSNCHYAVVKSNSLFHFILVACLPIKIKRATSNNYNNNYNNNNTTSTCPSPKAPPPPSLQRNPRLPLNFPIKVLLFAILVSAHDYIQHYAHPKIVLLVYCGMVYLLVDIIFGLSNGLLHATCGMELEPPSDEPYLSTSLQDFWGKRWNLTVTNVLRHTIYKPVRSFSGNVVGPKWAPIPAVLAAFVVSGLMHELVFYYVTRESPTWEVTWYFVLHGACVVVEFWMKRVFSGRFQLHWAVSTPLTVGFVVLTALWLFFPPVIRTGAVERAMEDCKVLLNLATVLSKVKG